MLGVASRFSVLKIEGEERSRNNAQKLSDKTKEDKKLSANSTKTTKQQPQKKKAAGNSVPKKQTNPDKNAGPSKNKGKNQKPKPISDAQWEEWKKKDEELTNTSYEDDLQEAILRSKLDFEQVKEANTQIEREEKSASAAGKKKKAKAMSLEQFNNMQDLKVNGKKEPPNSPDTVDPLSSLFFEKIKDETKKVIQKENKMKLLKDQEPFINDRITIAQYKAKLDDRDAEIKQLKAELESLREEMISVKARNKMLCSMLGEAEMKEKASILSKVDNLLLLRDELTEEVTNLHIQLEQERSKVRSLTNSEGKGKGGKKRTTSETANTR